MESLMNNFLAKTLASINALIAIIILAVSTLSTGAAASAQGGSGMFVVGAVIGAMACFWIVALGRLAVSAPPTALGQLALWALGGAVIGTAFGARYPRLATCLLLPFSTFGAGN